MRESFTIEDTFLVLAIKIKRVTTAPFRVQDQPRTLHISSRSGMPGLYSRSEYDAFC
jgi:hypothetical protein